MVRELDRREFLGSMAGLSAVVFLGGCGGKEEFEAGSLPVRDPTFDTKDLAVASGKDPGAMTRAAVDALGGMKKLVKSFWINAQNSSFFIDKSLFNHINGNF